MSGCILLQLEARIGGMHDIYLAMGAQILRAGRMILSGPGDFIFLAVTHPTREFTVGLNEDVHRGRQFGIGGGEVSIGPHQLFQQIIFSGSVRSEEIKMFVEVSIPPGWTICLFLFYFRRLPKCAVSVAKLVLASNGFLLDLGLPVICLVQLLTGRPIFSFLVRSSQISSAWGKRSVESMVFVAMRRRVSSVMGFPALLERFCASSSMLTY